MKKEIIIEPNQEQRNQSGYYIMDFYCSNCHNSSGLGFDGIQVMIPEKENSKCVLICPNCKNKTLTR